MDRDPVALHGRAHEGLPAVSIAAAAEAKPLGYLRRGARPSSRFAHEVGDPARMRCAGRPHAKPAHVTDAVTHSGYAQEVLHALLVPGCRRRWVLVQEMRSALQLGMTQLHHKLQAHSGLA
eukprot:4157273-Alexandrium_andersonii.AAC.1